MPASVWPRVMADVSAVTQIILSKYDMCLPLHRQERASPRCGYHLPRSTQCDWIETAHSFVYRIVDAMFEDSMHAHCLATDATTAPIRAAGKSVPWHVFVFIADASHVVFRPARKHDGETIRTFLREYKGYLLADAATIYDALYEAGFIVEVSCWAHLRRYFFKARATEPALALEALAIIGKIFEVGREAQDIPMPERTAERARRMQPHLDLLDRWIAANRSRVESRTKLAAAFTYYDNQYDTLRTFLRDGELRLDNNISEQQLRHLVLGLHNWNVFETSAGLDWYCVFRSLIASCSLHGIEAQSYLDEVLRLAPHWPISDMLALSPRDWARTRASLSAEQRAIVSPPWIHNGAMATRSESKATNAA
jgi:transposase